MFDIGTGELFLILVVVLIAFGPKKLPELAQSLGRGLREFRRAQREFTDQINSAIEMEHQKQTRTVSRTPTSTMRSDPAPGIGTLAGGITTGDEPAGSVEPVIAPPHVGVPPQSPAPAGEAAPAPLPPDETPIHQIPPQGSTAPSVEQLPIFAQQPQPKNDT